MNDADRERESDARELERLRKVVDGLKRMFVTGEVPSDWATPWRTRAEDAERQLANLREQASLKTDLHEAAEEAVASLREERDGLSKTLGEARRDFDAVRSMLLEALGITYATRPLPGVPEMARWAKDVIGAQQDAMDDRKRLTEKLERFSAANAAKQAKVERLTDEAALLREELDDRDQALREANDKGRQACAERDEAIEALAAAERTIAAFGDLAASLRAQCDPASAVVEQMIEQRLALHAPESDEGGLGGWIWVHGGGEATEGLHRFLEADWDRSHPDSPALKFYLTHEDDDS